MAGTSEQTAEQLAVAETGPPIARPVAAAAQAADQGDVAPDWATLSEEICCPLFEYNLRGLAEARCPECGARYKWSELLDPRTQRHPYLFEHHPEANWRSFWRTMIGGLRPWTFWRSMHPLQKCVLSRLALYAVVAVFVLTICVAGIYVANAARIELEGSLLQRLTRRNTVRLTLSESIVQAATDLRWEHYLAIAYVSGLVVTWPLLTFLTLMIFRVSMRKAKVKVRHVARCVINSTDHSVLLALWFLASLCAMLALLALDTGMSRRWPPQSGAYSTATIVWAVLVGLRLLMHALGDVARRRRAYRLSAALLNTAILVITPCMFTAPMDLLSSMVGVAGAFAVMRLIVSFNAYLQFHRPMLTVLASQIIVGLIYVNVGVVLSNLF